MNFFPVSTRRGIFSMLWKFYVLLWIFLYTKNIFFIVHKTNTDIVSGHLGIIPKLLLSLKVHAHSEKSFGFMDLLRNRTKILYKFYF